MRRALALLLAATFVQVCVVTADASPGGVKLGAKAYNAKTGAPVEGVTILAFAVSPNGQDPNGKPLGQDTTDRNGHFQLVLPSTTALVNVRIRVIPLRDALCPDVRLVGIVGAATSEAAQFMVKPPEHLNANESGAISTFAPVGFVTLDGSVAGHDPCLWKLGPALYTHRDLE